MTSQPLTVPIIFANLPPGPIPMSYFDENFAFVTSNFNGLLTQFFQSLPTTLPATPNTVWNNGGVICITGP